MVMRALDGHDSQEGHGIKPWNRSKPWNPARPRGPCGGQLADDGRDRFADKVRVRAVRGGAMETAVVIGLIVAAVLASLVWVGSRVDPDEISQLRSRVREAKRNLKVTERRREKAIKAAQSSLKQAEKEYEGKVRAASAALDRLISPTGERLGSYHGIKLYERLIETPHGKGSLRGVRAIVDTAGNLIESRRPTLTRMAAGGLLLGPLGMLGSLAVQKKKKVDARELYLLIEGGGMASVVRCPPEDGQKAREFAAKINAAASRAERLEAERPQKTRAARRELEEVTADKAAIEVASEAVRRTESDRGLQEAVDRARGELNEAEQALEEKKRQRQ